MDQGGFLSVQPTEQNPLVAGLFGQRGNQDHSVLDGSALSIIDVLAELILSGKG